MNRKNFITAVFVFSTLLFSCNSGKKQTVTNQQATLQEEVETINNVDETPVLEKVFADAYKKKFKMKDLLNDPEIKYRLVEKNSQLYYDRMLYWAGVEDNELEFYNGIYSVCSGESLDGRMYNSSTCLTYNTESRELTSSLLENQVQLGSDLKPLLGNFQIMYSEDEFGEPMKNDPIAVISLVGKQRNNNDERRIEVSYMNGGFIISRPINEVYCTVSQVKIKLDDTIYKLTPDNGNNDNYYVFREFGDGDYLKRALDEGNFKLVVDDYHFDVTNETQYFRNAFIYIKENSK